LGSKIISRVIIGIKDPQDILTFKVFNENPGIVWRWGYDFIELVKKFLAKQGSPRITKVS
jgi:hypothetical protein